MHISGDGSPTIYSEEFGEHYHSVFGAVNESMHIFIRNGLLVMNAGSLNILEVGMGTGLNVLLSHYFSEQKAMLVNYHAIEKFPLKQEEWSWLDYKAFHEIWNERVFRQIHESDWGTPVYLSPGFALTKIHSGLLEFNSGITFDLVYFDAFSPEVQPELWTTQVFQFLTGIMNQGGVLVTYSCKGDVRRAMQAAGLSVEKLKGPAGKREMLRAVKKS